MQSSLWTQIITKEPIKILSMSFKLIGEELVNIEYASTQRNSWFLKYNQIENQSELRIKTLLLYLALPLWIYSRKLAKF